MTDAPSSVGIIGGGIGGCAAAHFYRETFTDGCEIQVFERDESVGGRIQRTMVSGYPLELGGVFFHETNRYIQEFASSFGLNVKNGIDDVQPLGIWTGDEFVVIEESLRSVARLLLRYGLDPLRMRRVCRDALDDVAKLYEPLEAGRAFDTSKAMLETAGLDGLTRRTATDYFGQRGIGDRMIEEVVSGLARSVYGSSDAHALATLMASAVSMSAGDMSYIEGGNSQLCEGLLDTADATLRTETSVTAVETNGDEVVVKTDDSEETFDDVVLATPFETADLTVTGPDGSLAIADRPFYENDIVVVEGEVDSTTFGGEPLPQFFMFAQDVSPPITSLWRLRDGLYEVIGPSVSTEVLDDVFSSWERIDTHHWHAWPSMESGVQHHPFHLAPGVFYVNAIESCFSTMELAVVGARNVVNHIARARDAAP